MKRAAYRISSVLAAASLFAGACTVEHNNALAPSGATTSYLGTWTSSSAATTPGACGSFEWRVTNQTATMISGVFFARCPGNLTVSGSAWGELKEPGATSIPVSATAGATGPGVLVCDVSMKGTAVVDGDTIRIPYSGTTCQGPVSGTEVLQRH